MGGLADGEVLAAGQRTLIVGRAPVGFQEQAGQLEVVIPPGDGVQTGLVAAGAVGQASGVPR